MFFGPVAGGTGKIEAVLGHVDIDITLGVHQRRIKVAVLDAVAAVTQEVARAARGAAGFADTERQFREVWFLYGFAHSLAVVIDVACGAFGLSQMHPFETISPSGVVANEAIDLFLSREIECFVRPVETDMTAGAEWLVRRYGHERVVEHILHAQQLSGFLVLKIPGPVRGCMDLQGGLIMATEANLGYLWPRGKALFQHLELGVICR